MDAAEFISGIRDEVRDASVEDTVAILRSPPGRQPAPDLVALSEWFNHLPPADQGRVREVAQQAADYAVFGMLCVLDNIRVVRRESGNGEFELRYADANGTTLLNSPEGEFLHDLFVEAIAER
jgi:hypothetical protein